MKRRSLEDGFDMSFRMPIRGINPFHLATLVVLFVSTLFTTYNVYRLHDLQQAPHHGGDDEYRKGQLHYAVFAKNPDKGYLKHVWAVLERTGYTRIDYNASSDWSVMWAHTYPFRKIKHVFKNMKPHQKVNKLPGSGFVTNKVELVTSGLPNVPKAFKLPADKGKLLSYAAENPNMLFVQKNDNHRGIQVQQLEEMQLDKSGSFVQEFVGDPLLIDGYKFDIGIYTVVTSIDPLRIYVFSGDVLVRFCPELYNPFDPKDKNKYVVHDDYRPTWKVPTLSKLYSDLGYTFKETLNIHIRSLGRDPDEMWDAMHEVIRSVYKSQEENLAKAASGYPHKRGFFEMVRFDFVLDSKLNVYLMEANMSPNLSSGHYQENRLLYEQVVYSLLRLVGVARPGVFGGSLAPGSREEAEMQASDKDVHVFGSMCSSKECSEPESCSERACWLCKPCLSTDEANSVRSAYLEHCNRHATRRLYPKPVSHKEALEYEQNGMPQMEEDRTKSNQKMNQWFVGKCAIDSTWCS